MRGLLADKSRRTLLTAWRYLPLWARRVAIRVLYPRFPVGAVAIILDPDGRVLLLRQTYHRREQWGAPGGWIRQGEAPGEAAARETLEEIGLRVDVGRVLATGSGPYREISLAFECRPIGDAPLRFSDEVDGARYFAPNELPPMPLGTRRLVEDALAALNAAPVLVSR